MQRQRRSATPAAGSNSYVTTPFDFDELLATLSALLGAPAPDTAPKRRRASDAETEAAELADLVNQRTPGIDIGDTIKGHNGNVKVMLKLMGDFGRYYGDAGQRMREVVTEPTRPRANASRTTCMALPAASARRI